MTINLLKASLIGGLALFCAAPAFAQDATAPLSSALVPAPAAPAVPAIAAPTPSGAAAPAAGGAASTSAVVIPQPAPAATPTDVGAAAPAAAGATSVPAAAAASATTPDAAKPATAAAAEPATGADAKPTTAAAAKPRPKARRIATAAPARQDALSTDPQPSYGPDTIYATDEAIGRYGAIVQAGGWPTIPEALRPGSRGDAVTLLRRRLVIEGDLDASKEGDAPYNAEWDNDLTLAVKHFQARMGLAETGIVAGDTLKAMNVPADERWRELSASAERLNAQTFSFAPRYVVVNIPAAQVEAVQDGKVVHHYVAIVGDVKHQSPEIAAHVQSIELNPFWTLPVSIIKNEVIPLMRKDPAYLRRNHIRILDGKGNEINPTAINWDTDRAADYTLRQDSGPADSLGQILINMPNNEAVYMHDTPGKGLFGGDFRFLSHGCVRVDGVWDLAAWLLDGTEGSPSGSYDKAELLKEMSTTQHTEIKLAKSVPVIWVYLTGWATPDGTVHFRDDVYNMDAARGQIAKAGDP